MMMLLLLLVVSQSSHKEHTPQRIPVGIKSSSRGGGGESEGRCRTGQGWADEQQIHTHTKFSCVFRLQGTKKSRQHTHTHIEREKECVREGRKRMHINS